jgi:hypothetical protein
VKTAMPVFFAELLKDGQVDRAMARARASVRDRPDSWMPALFLRLKGGKIWYEPGFGEGDFEWGGLVDCVESGEFTPIVGPGLGERVYGSLRGAARELAEQAGFPLALHQRDEMPQVAQFLRNQMGGRSQRLRVSKQLKKQIVQGQSTLTPEEAGTLDLSELMTRVGRANRDDPADPYRILAKLPARVFLTANTDNLLQEALEAEGKQPDVFVFKWWEKTVGVDGYAKMPEAMTPLVFHLFGQSEDDSFMVLTEDDHFDHLIRWNEYKERIPRVVGHQTTTASLLFLGFRPTDLSFRMLLRLIKSQEGSDQLAEFPHVAVQIDPEDDDCINVRKARTYLEEYFKSAAATKFAIFWGSAVEFLQELDRRLNAG